MAEEYLDPKNLPALFGDTSGVSADFDWSKAIKAVTDFLTSGGGAALGGAALGYLDRPKPSGGGTTTAMPAAPTMERKMIQGPYGPIAQYTGPGGGPLDLTPFKAPQTTFAPAPSPLTQPTAPRRSIQAMVDEYNTLRGYGLSDDRVRRIAESIYGTIPDSDWAELKRLAGATGGIAAPAPTPAPSPAPAPTPAPRITAPVPTPAPRTITPTPTPAPAPISLTAEQKTVQAELPTERARTAYKRLAESYNAPGDVASDAAKVAETMANIYTGSGQKGISAEDVASLASAGAAPDITAQEVKSYLGQAGLTPEQLQRYQNIGASDQALYGDLARAFKQRDASGIKSLMSQNKLTAQDVARISGIDLPTVQAYLAAYREGGPVRMEDGGFVLTKKAVDGAGGPQGIASLVPGARPIVGPGTGTSDSIPATIRGPRGMTPARVSNGEAYIPKRAVDAQGGPQELYALMNALQRNA